MVLTFVYPVRNINNKTELAFWIGWVDLAESHEQLVCLDSFDHTRQSPFACTKFWRYARGLGVKGGVLLVVLCLIAETQ